MDLASSCKRLTS